MVVYVWRAPEGTAAKYCTVTESGELIRAWARLSDIRAWYKLTDTSGEVAIIRQLEKVYSPRLKKQ